ncbi:MAG: hypothetical protein ACRDZU_12010, partial [Acidimicrobiales bacterium]
SEALDAFLAAPGPPAVPEPERLERYERAAATAGDGLADTMGVEAAYAFLSYAQRALADPMWETELGALGERLPRPEPDAPYLEVELAALPPLAKPLVKPKQLSNGDAPLEIARVGSGWRISCTGCGESSPLVQFRWQALDQSVVCRCE